MVHQQVHKARSPAVKVEVITTVAFLFVGLLVVYWLAPLNARDWGSSPRW